jgi:Skp family chaperone for outer membrane proteins
MALAALSAMCAAPVLAQTGAPAPTKKIDAGIRVIDIERAFKQHVRYNQQLDELKEIAKGMEAEVNKEKVEIQEMDKTLLTLKSGTDERKALDEKILRRKTDLAARTRMKQQELIEKEAKIYYFTYKEIQDEVAVYCRQTGVSIVLQYSSEKVDPNNRTSIMKAMGNPVVHHEGIDITDKILYYLNPRGSAAKGATDQANRDTGDVPRAPRR